MLPTYTEEYRIPSPFYYVIRDAEDEHATLLFHVHTGDYFRVLATICGFAEEVLAAHADDPATVAVRAAVHGMKEDLLFLHDRYEIREKTDAPYRLYTDD